MAGSSRIDKDLNLRMTQPSGSSIIWSITLRSISAGGWGSCNSISSGRVILSHLRGFGVKTIGLSSSICNKIVPENLKEKD